MITVGTWNMQNLFRPGADSGPDSDQAYEAKLAALADVITRMAPDVLAVQESRRLHYGDSQHPLSRGWALRHRARGCDSTGKR